MTAFDPLKISRDLDLCAPYFKSSVQKALAECAGLGYMLSTFEAFRTPERQDWLFEQGRGREGKIVTKSRGWESWHQYGLAIDGAFWIGGKWTWDGPWDKVAPILFSHGLDSLAPFEQAHFQITGGLTIKEARQITQKSGLQSLWQKIAAARSSSS